MASVESQQENVATQRRRKGAEASAKGVKKPRAKSSKPSIETARVQEEILTGVSPQGGEKGHYVLTSFGEKHVCT